MTTDGAARTDGGTAGLGGGRCLLIGEVAQAHDGSVGMAHAFIDAIARAGADAVKFQTHLAAAESTSAEPFRIRFSPQDADRHAYWKRMEFTAEQWQGLAIHARERNLLFLSSPFSLEAVDLLEKVGVPMWKVASGEVTHGPLIDRLLETGRPLLVSTGLVTLAELDGLVNRIRARGVALAVLQCTTAYPCPPEKIGLNVIPFFRERYGSFVGLSDHSGTIFPGLAAATIGIDVLEVHVTLSREMFGPDVAASVTTAELGQLVDGVRFVERMRAHPVDKEEAFREARPLREVFGRSLVARIILKAGTEVRASDVVLKKPGTGIPATDLGRVVGKRVKRDVEEDSLLRWEDLDA
jgi:N-acetylneuraminate synthase